MTTFKKELIELMNKYFDTFHSADIKLTEKALQYDDKYDLTYTIEER